MRRMPSPAARSRTNGPSPLPILQQHVHAAAASASARAPSARARVRGARAPRLRGCAWRRTRPRRLAKRPAHVPHAPPTSAPRAPRCLRSSPQSLATPRALRSACARGPCAAHTPARRTCRCGSAPRRATSAAPIRASARRAPSPQRRQALYAHADAPQLHAMPPAAYRQARPPPAGRLPPNAPQAPPHRAATRKMCAARAARAACATRLRFPRAAPCSRQSRRGA
eukprot:143300-Chlamydomonas_euryale.AAC.1